MQQVLILTQDLIIYEISCAFLLETQLFEDKNLMK